jgi:GNAT superfamily N-acetyltransferase
MKQKRFYSLITFALGLCLSTIVSANEVFNLEKSSARFINIETPFRCSVQKSGDLAISTTLPLQKNDFKLTFFDKMDDLPRYEVNGLSFTKKPIDEALQYLVDEAGIAVYTEDGFYPSMDAEDVYGELTDVVDELSKSGDIFYRYDADKKELYLSRKGRFELKVPNDRMVMLAVLDALRGTGIADIRPNWKENTILISVTQKEKETVEELLSYIKKDGYLLLADIQVFSATPKSSNTNWQQVIRQFGAEQIYSANNGLSGKILTMGNQIPTQKFLKTAETEFNIMPLSQGVAIVPNNWKMRFNIGQCSSNKDLTDLSVLLNARILGSDKIETNVTLDSRKGEIGSFNTVAFVDNELLMVGVPLPNASQEEFLTAIKLRLIRLEKEQ